MFMYHKLTCEGNGIDSFDKQLVFTTSVETALYCFVIFFFLPVFQTIH